MDDMGCCSTVDKIYNLGESKFVDLIVSSRQDDVTVVINSASYELFYGDELEIDGSMIIDGNMASVLLSPSNIGDYRLKCTILVSGELLISNIRIKVV